MPSLPLVDPREPFVVEDADNESVRESEFHQWVAAPGSFKAAGYTVPPAGNAESDPAPTAPSSQLSGAEPSKNNACPAVPAITAKVTHTVPDKPQPVTTVMAL